MNTIIYLVVELTKPLIVNVTIVDQYKDESFTVKNFGDQIFSNSGMTHFNLH